MYDADTARLIRSTPVLDGLDRERLPEDLSDAFARIAAIRLRLRTTGEIDSEELAELINSMQRLALTNEALVSVSPNRADRAAAAFVAGSAHQLCFNARRIGRERASDSFVSAQSISSDIAAMLLFLVAEATADANELSVRIQANEGSVLERALIEAMKSLARGDLVAITSSALPARDFLTRVAAGDAAALSLYYTILKGVRLLASQLLGEEGVEVGQAIEIFRAVQRLSSATVPVDSAGWLASEIGAFAGPHHLASLLLAVAGDLSDSSVTAIEPPGDIDPERWSKSVRRIAKERPYLWRNHREAIAKGYLDPGTSAAVSFPTGAGKSTLAELKINATLLSDRKVVFLAPTNALVGQTTVAMRRSFKGSTVGQERFDEFGFLTDDDELPEIFVMTPEACLAQMSIDSSVFDGVGLLVFDECHLLHADDDARGRRPLDAMLCVLNFAALVPDANLLLLSAMMKNTEEIAGWVEELTERRCLPLSLAWKPTRQLRGSVVYHNAEVVALGKGLVRARSVGKTNAPSTSDKARLVSKPLGLFSLKQTWATRNIKDYALLELLNENVQLAANKYWKLTPNSGEVSSAIGAAASDSGIKTLIFFQTIRNAVSAKEKVSKSLKPVRISLRDDELAWLEIVNLEMGGEEHTFLDIEQGELISRSVVHHGLLLAEERQLCESLYLRPDGATVMTATSTVAQGMNFPSELVIIAEDSRFDEAKNKREVLEAQELLNAAGRAGRAGQNANGIVLVIPGRVVSINFEDATIGSHWTTLQKVFGQSDQCLEIDDPLTAILDRVHANIDDEGDLERYAVARLATVGADGDPDEQLARTLSKTLASFRAKKSNREDWMQSRIATALAFRKGQAPESEEELSEHQIASTLGIPLTVVSRLSKDLASEKIGANTSVSKWRRWFFGWISANSDLFDQIFRPETMNDLLGKKFEALELAEERAEFAIPYLKELTRLWMAGRPLKDLQLALGTPVEKLKACLDARKFVLRVVPELAYLFGIPALLRQRQNVAAGGDVELQPALLHLGRCVRQGFKTHEQAALNQHLRSARLVRRQLHQRYALIEPYLPDASDGESWDDTMKRVAAAVEVELDEREDS